MATGPTGWASCESSLVTSQPASTFSQKRIKIQRASVFRSSLPRSHSCHNWVLQFRPSHKRMQGSVLRYYGSCKQLLLKLSFFSQQEYSWVEYQIHGHLSFLTRDLLTPPVITIHCFTPMLGRTYNWHSEHQREGMGTTEQWMDPHFMSNLMMIMLRVQVLFPSSCI